MSQKQRGKTKANRVNHLGRNNYKGSIRVAYNKWKTTKKRLYNCIGTGVYIQLLIGEVPLPVPRQYVTVRKHLDGSLNIVYRDKELLFEILKGKPKTEERIISKPKADHPWRQ